MEKSYPKKIKFFILLSGLILGVKNVYAQNASSNQFQEAIIHQHRQINMSSCIPSGIEMILKLNCKVESDFYNYQQIWGNKTDGTFGNFNNLVINGIRFFHKFNLQRDNNFPLADLFYTIEEELAQNRYVLVSLVSGQNMWHIYVISEKLPNGEFKAYSKIDERTLIVSNVKEFITKMKGTDIMVYREEPGN